MIVESKHETISKETELKYSYTALRTIETSTNCGKEIT